MTWFQAIPGLAVRGLALVAAVVTLNATEFLVVTRAANGQWSLQTAESILLNGKEKVRRVTAAAGAPAVWDAKSIGRAPNVSVDSFSVIRRAPDGALYGQAGASAEWEPLLPDGLKPDAPQTAAQLWAGSSLAWKRDKKDKTPTPLRPEELYAVVIGADAAEAAAGLATSTELHKAPGVTDDDAFAAMVSLLPGAEKAFPKGPASDRLREYPSVAMAERLARWTSGDAPLKVLDESLALATASEAAFPGDAKQIELRKRVRETRASLDRKVAILRALDAGKQSDAFLLAYRDFEVYDKSFSDLAAARQTHLKASAALHFQAAQRSREAGDYARAIHHLRLATWRDPGLKEAADMLEEVRLEVARLSSQKFAELRRGIDPRSPKQVQIQRRLRLADQYINDGKAADAEQAVNEAENIDKDEPRITLLRARLAGLQGDLGRALALLDLYAGLATTPEDFDEGEKLRAGIQYKIDSSRKDTHLQLAGLYTEQRFAAALESSANGLKLDNEDTQFLFQAGVNACILRNCDDAAPLLRRYLDITDSTSSNREQRMTAMRLLRAAGSKASTKPPARGSASSWFSGAPLEPGVFYDPVSLAFQPRVARIKASSHLSVAYDWAGNQLKSVHTKYEDKKMASNVLKVVAAGAAASQGIGSTVAWKTPDRETNDFYFNYYDDYPQILKVSRDNVVVKSRTIPIGIPGIGMFGFGGLGALTSGLGGLRGMSGMSGMSGMGGMGGLGRMSSMGGFGGVQGFGGVGGAGALRALQTSQTLNSGASMGLGGINGINRQFNSARTWSIHDDPQGGSTSGFLTLWNSPRLDTDLAFRATGKRVAVGFAGNSFFHPFVWDAIHLFEFDYDAEGRVRHAWEIANPSSPRLDFTWDGRRLMQVTGRAPDGDSILYTRTLQYSGDKLMSENITYNGKTSRIQYKYDKQGNLTEADCQDDHSLDGRSRQVEFMTGTAGEARR